MHFIDDEVTFEKIKKKWYKDARPMRRLRTQFPACCGKRVYSTQTKAAAAVKAVLETGHKVLRAYHCECGDWHLTSRPVSFQQGKGW